jgi:hypothetical protein
MAQVDLGSLPDECIVRALVFLSDVRDVKNFQATCKRFRALGDEPEVWRSRLRSEFDLAVKVSQQADATIAQNTMIEACEGCSATGSQADSSFCCRQRIWSNSRCCTERLQLRESASYVSRGFSQTGEWIWTCRDTGEEVPDISL